MKLAGEANREAGSECRVGSDDLIIPLHPGLRGFDEKGDAGLRRGDVYSANCAGECDNRMADGISAAGVAGVQRRLERHLLRGGALRLVVKAEEAARLAVPELGVESIL